MYKIKRADAIMAIRYAGYHNDVGKALRLYIDNRVSYQAYTKAYVEGIRLREKGTPCGCSDCKGEK